MAQDKIIDQSLIDAANEYGALVTKNMKWALRRGKRGYATGALHDSLKFRLVATRQGNYQIQFDMLNYGKFIDKGTGPVTKTVTDKRTKKTRRVWPNISAIQKWMKVKGIPKDRLWGIAFNIREYGIEPVPFMHFYKQDLAKMKAMLEKKGAKAVERVVKNEIDKNKKK